MRVAISVAFVCSTLALSGCATTQYSIAPESENGQQIIYNQGIAVVNSDESAGAVRVTLLGFTPHGRLRLGIAVLNKGNSPSNIGYENVRIVDASGVPMHALDHDEMVRMAQRQANAAKFAVALAGGLSAVANAQAATTTTYGSVGNTNFHATTYDPYLANRLNEQTSAETGAALGSIDARLAAATNSINGTILQTTTVLPQQTYAGELYINAPRDEKGDGRITVTVTFAGEDHIFHMNLVRKA